MFRILLKDSPKIITRNTFKIHCRKYKSQNLPLQAGFGKFLLILTPLAATGGIVAYANYDKEFRKTLVSNVPGSDSVLKFLLQEENPFKPITEKFENISASFSGFFGSSSNDSTVEKNETPPIRKKFEQKHSAPEKQSTKSNVSGQETMPKVAPAKPSAPIVISTIDDKIPKELSELENAIEKSAAVAVQEYNKAIKILKHYNEDVRRVVDEAVEKIDLKAWNTLKNKTGARNTAVNNAEQAAKIAMDYIEKCQLALSKAVDAGNHEHLVAIRNKIKTLTDHIINVKEDLYKNKDNSTLSEKYWQKVEMARNFYVDEIESIFPGLILSEKKLNLSKDDLDLFLIHAYSYVLAYQKELQRLQIDGELRLKRAIEALRGDNPNEAIQSQLEYLLEKEKRNMNLENQKKIFQIRNDLDQDLRMQMKKQSQAHVDHLNEALAQKETELKRNFTRELDEKLAMEKASYKLQLASMLGKLKGMDTALKARAESERCAHQAQALWAACQALWASVRTGEPGIHWREKLRPLKSEIAAVSKAAADGDELVAVVLQNIPREVEDRGVYPEDALRERFLNVEKVARKVAIVPADGASIPTYILSYIQSLLIMRPDNPITEDELKDQTFDFSKLDTYDILDRARYYVDRGDFTQALKYMNLLQGASRKISGDWIKETRLLLETQQAANTLMAHAAASGLLYL